MKYCKRDCFLLASGVLCSIICPSVICRFRLIAKRQEGKSSHFLFALSLVAERRYRSSRGGATVRVVGSDSDHRYRLMYWKDQFQAYPDPDTDTSFEMIERPIFDGTRRRGVVWNFHESVPVDVVCIAPLVKGQRRRFVRARIWISE